MFCVNEMSYRRDMQQNESIALPLETTFNSSIDGTVDGVYPNRVHFTYPPEWNTSNVNEKIIGIRNIRMRRKCRTLRFMLYIRKYKKEPFDGHEDLGKVGYTIQLLDDLLDDLPGVFWEYINRPETAQLKKEVNEQSQVTYNRFYYQLGHAERLVVMRSVLTYDEVTEFMYYPLDDKERDDINKQMNSREGEEARTEIQLAAMNPNDVIVFRIPIQITIDEHDSWNDIHDKLMKCVSRTNLYEYIRSEIITKGEYVAERLTELNSIRDDYDLMLLKCSDLIEYSIPFYITNNDVDIISYTYNQTKQLVIRQPSDILDDNDKYYCDYLITPDNNESYNRVYKWPDNIDKPDYMYPYLIKSNNIDFGLDCFAHNQDTSNFLNIGSNPAEYINKYHRELYFHGVRTDLDCRIAASFANQSNRNIIGHTNESFENIKYYRLNDNGTSFWIECYDNDDINIPISFNNDVVLTMDVVFLQNRKLLYS